MTMSGKQRFACYELLRRGDISWLLHPEQRRLLDWIDAKNREISVICMSRQWGKTFMLLAYCIAHCLANPMHTVLFMAPHLLQLDKILMPRLNQIFAFFPDDLVPQSRRNERWTFRNGSVLRMDGVSVGRGVRMRGDTANLAVIDECRDIADLDTLVGSHIAPMFTTTSGRMVLISTPPDTPGHSFTDHFIREALARNDFYSATYKQNPLLSTDRLRYLINVLYPGGEANPTFRREYLADYTVADVEKRVVREYNETKQDEFFKEYKGPQNLVRPYIGLDSGYADPAGVIAGFFDPAVGALIVVEEFFKRHMTTAKVGEQIMAMEKKLMAKLPPGCPEAIRIMDIDPAQMADLYSMYGLRFEPAHKINSNIAMLNRLRVSVAESRVLIHPDCEQLRFQMRTGVFNQRETDYVKTTRTGHLDLIDALKYVVLNARWNELLFTPPTQGLRHNQMRIGFQHPSTFRGGIIQRPI